jgi:hypothetical protein
LRHRIRYQLYRDLVALGLDVDMAPRGRREEGVYGGLLGNSLGLIEVRGGAVRWVNVLAHPGNRFSPTTYTNVYVVPDSRLRSGGYVEMKSVRVRDASVYGRVVDLHWRASFITTRAVVVSDDEVEGAEAELTARMDADSGLKETLIRLNEDIAVRSVPNYWCWAISSGSFHEGGGREARRLAPSRDQWDCYETIARLLVESGEAED